MSSLGIKIEQFDTPVCNSFKALNFIGQLCYELDVKDFIPRDKISEEIDLGLTLIIDKNEDKQWGLDRNFTQSTLSERLGK